MEANTISLDEVRRTRRAIRHPRDYGVADKVIDPNDLGATYVAYHYPGESRRTVFPVMRATTAETFALKGR